jgi:hypothetical protein
VADTERDKDDPSRLAEEAASQVAKQAADLRAVKVPIETEPPTTFRP